MAQTPRISVGFVEGLIWDSGRTNWDGDGPRPIRWSAWYPADAAAIESVVALPPDERLFVMGRVARDAALSFEPRTFPVVLLSHGTGGTAASLGWLAEKLAAHGFIVIAADHHGNTASELYRPEGFLCWWERPRDLTVLLDALHTQGMFAGRLDVDRVSAAGFSLGGHTVLSLAGAITDMTLFQAWAEGQPGGRGPREFPDLADHIAPLLERSAVFRSSWERQSLSYVDRRVKAVLACAPAPPVRGFTPQSLAAIRVLVTMAVGGADVEAPAEAGAMWLDDHLADSMLHLLGPDIGHYVFLCEGTPKGCAAEPAIWSDPPDVPRRVVHERVADIALRAFSRPPN